MKATFTPKYLIEKVWALLLLAGIFAPVFGQRSHTVEVTSNVFTPDEVTISPGDTVIWINSQGSHNVNGTQVTFPANPESFGNAVGAGWTFQHVFTIPGTYDYQCDPHAGWGMVGKVRVEDNSGPGSDITVNLTAMNPHVGQEIYFALIDEATGDVIDRESETVQESFSVVLSGVVSGRSYRIDFFTDHNGNGYYDAPPTDHAWRLEVPDAQGGEILNFAHNTDFTDIQWKHRLRVRFEGMTPHLGQTLTLYVWDLVAGTYLDTVVTVIEDAKFDVESHILQPGGTYQVDFFADHNGNGTYDAPPADHAWRLETGITMGDVDLDFTHNTNFTDIFGTTGLGYNTDLKVDIFPNPASESIHIVAGEEILTVHLINSAGVVLRNINNVGTSHVVLPLDGIPAGLYFLEVKSPDLKQQMSRIVVQ